MSRTINRASAVAVLMLAASPVSAHTIVGNRVFPATLSIDDPGVNDELALPSFSYLQSSNFDGSAGTYNYSLGWDYAKTITPDLALSIGSGDEYQWTNNPKAEGWGNIETQAKLAFYQDPDHEFIMSAAVQATIGGTGSPGFSDPFTTITPKFYIGKGFGDAPVDWLKPFAVTGEVDYNIPTVTINGDGSYNPTVITYGGSLQYSLPYENAFVHQVPDFFNRLIPAFEGIFNTPVANEGPVPSGDFSPYETTGVVGPSLYYIGQYFEVGVMAQIPINRASGSHVGALAVLDIFLDDIAPTSLGKPLFSAPLSPFARR
jgi:hypothetical protein